MFTVALIGADGSGKTTIAHRLLESLPMPTKYLYMGTSIGSSNVALPTSRLLLYLKQKAYRKSSKESDKSFSDFIVETSSRRSKVYASLRLLNRLIEEWYRQLVSWVYQLRNYVVIYDRHYLYEFAAQHVEMQSNGKLEGENRRLSERLHLWFLYNCYPKPDLVIFLDAPAKILLERKKEWTKEHLQKHNDAMSQWGEKSASFVRIDASQPIDSVLEEAKQQIMVFYQSKENK